MTCPRCDRAVSILLFIICAYCKLAWQPYEFESEWIWRSRESERVDD